MIDSTDFISTPDFDLNKGYLSLRPEDDLLYLTQASLKSIVCDASWKMVYAKSDAEFEQLWDKMVADCKASGAQQLIDWRLNDIEEAIEEWKSNQ
jgi:multiple sugar transport system substrate-binding protein/putative aldouronate transport system substrate-binding protein